MPPPPFATTVDEGLAWRDGAGSGWASTRPLGTEPVTSVGLDLDAVGLENGLSLKRVVSALQPATPAAMSTKAAARADRRDWARERMISTHSYATKTRPELIKLS